MISLNGVTQRFGNHDVLRGVDLTIEPGEVVGLIGPNGAGKTTTLNIAATLVRPLRGGVTLDGADAFANARRSRLLLGYMPETLGLYEDMTVTEYLVFFCRAYGLPKSAALRQAESTLARLDLLPSQRETVGKLSKGTRQRVCFARTLVHEPRVLLLDEPFTALDPIGCRRVRSMIREEAARGRCFLISSHDMAELESVATRVVIIRDGRLVERPLESSPVFEIRLDEPAERCLALLAEKLPGLKLSSPAPRTVIAQAPPGMPASSILRPLVEADVLVAAFVRRDQGLEEFFLEEFSADAHHA